MGMKPLRAIAHDSDRAVMERRAREAGCAEISQGRDRAVAEAMS